MKHLSILFLIIIAFVTAGFGGGKYKERKAKTLYRPDLFVNEQSIPSVASIRNPKRSFDSDPQNGVIIGTTDYDFGWNSGFPRRIASYGSSVHMIFPERDVTYSSPNNRLAVKYVYYNNNNLVTGYPRPKQVASTGGGSVDVFQTGDGAGIAVLAYRSGGINYFAIDAAPGSGNFTEVAFPQSLSQNVFGPQITVAPDGNSIWFVGTKNMSDPIIGRSTDFGQTWQVVDSLLKYLPKNVYSMVSPDCPLLISRSGTIYLVTSFQGSGSLPPIGDAHPDSADMIGYFKSTDQGKNWSWTTMIKDGEQLIVGTDTVYVLGENFSQFSAVVDDNERVHIVLNGYSVKPVGEENVSNYFYVLYANSELNGWVPVSNKNIAHIPDYDSSYYNYSGNAIGFPYPSIAVDKSGTFKFITWSQPILNGNSTLKLFNSSVQYEMFFNVGSTSFSVPTKCVNSVGALFTNVAPRIGRNKIINSIYLADTVAGSTVLSENIAPKVPWIFRTINFCVDCGGDFGYVTASSDSGGTINPKGVILTWVGTSVPFIIKSNSGYTIDSVVVNGKSIGSVSEFNLPNNGSEQTVHAYFSEISAGTNDGKELIPIAYNLYQNYPNPFNPETKISFDIPNDGFVSLTVYDALGREVKRLVNEEKSPGRYSVAWNAATMSSGIYYYRLTAGSFSETKRMVLMK